MEIKINTKVRIVDIETLHKKFKSDGEDPEFPIPAGYDGNDGFWWGIYTLSGLLLFCVKTQRQAHHACGIICAGHRFEFDKLGD